MLLHHRDHDLTILTSKLEGKRKTNILSNLIITGLPSKLKILLTFLDVFVPQLQQSFTLFSLHCHFQKRRNNTNMLSIHTWFKIHAEGKMLLHHEPIYFDQVHFLNFLGSESTFILLLLQIQKLMLATIDNLGVYIWP